MQLVKPFFLILLFLLTTLAFPWGSELCQGCRIDSSALAGPIYTWPNSTMLQQMISTNGTFLFQDDVNLYPQYSNGVKLEIRTQNKSPLRLAYDVNNYVDFSVGASGGLTINAIGGVVISSNGNVIIRNGNVGIGTISPLQKLHVAGSIRTTGAAGAGNVYLFDDTSYGYIVGGSNLSNAPNIHFSNPSRNVFEGGHLSLTAGYNASAGTTTSQFINFYTSNTERMRIGRDGNVGIGIAEALEKLHVAGTIRTNHEYERNIIFAANWAINDYIDVVQVATGVYGGLYEVSIQTSYASFAEHATFMVSGGHAAANAWRNAAAIDTSSYVGSGMNFTVDANGDSYYTKFRIRAIKTGGSTGATVMFKVRSIGNTSGWTTLTTSGSNGSVSGTYSSYGDSYSLYGGNASVGAGNLALFLNNSGNVGIGTTGPSYKLHVLSNPTGGSAAFSGDPDTTIVTKIQNTYSDGSAGDMSEFMPLSVDCPNLSGGGNTARCGIRLATGMGGVRLLAGLSSNANGASSFQIRNYNGSAWQTSMFIDNGGNVGIGTTVPAYKLDVAGGVNSSGGFTQVSDRRLKKNITPLRNSLEKVIYLQGVNYNWRTDEFPSKNFDTTTQIGFIAQDVERIVPEVVKTDAQGYKALSYDKLTAILVEAIKELKTEKDAQITSKNVEIQKQQKQIYELKNSYDTLKSTYDSQLKSLNQKLLEIKRLLAK